MPLQLGTWKVNVNGLQGDLVIQSVGAKGVLSGQIFGFQVRGFWDEGSQTLTFIAQKPLQVPPEVVISFTPPIEIELTQVIPHFFEGHLFRTPPVPEPGQDILWTLAGTVQDASGEGANGVLGTARRNVFGWFAQITQVL